MACIISLRYGFWFFDFSLLVILDFFFESNPLIVCRNQILRILWIMKPQLCWERTQSCSNLMWGGQWLVGTWDKPFSHAVCKPLLDNTPQVPCSDILSMLWRSMDCKIYFKNCILLSSVCYFSWWSNND